MSSIVALGEPTARCTGGIATTSSPIQARWRSPTDNCQRGHQLPSARVSAGNHPSGAHPPVYSSRHVYEKVQVSRNSLIVGLEPQQESDCVRRRQRNSCVLTLQKARQVRAA